MDFETLHPIALLTLEWLREGRGRITERDATDLLGLFLAVPSQETTWAAFSLVRVAAGIRDGRSESSLRLLAIADSARSSIIAETGALISAKATDVAGARAGLTGARLTRSAPRHDGRVPAGSMPAHSLISGRRRA